MPHAMSLSSSRTRSSLSGHQRLLLCLIRMASGRSARPATIEWPLENLVFALCCALSLTALAFISSAAKADLPAAVVTSLCYNGATVQASGNCSVGGTSVTASLGHGPSLETVASAGAPASATGYLDYNFMLTGGVVGTYVDIDVRALMKWTRGAPDGGALAQIIVDSGVGSTFAAICTGSCGWNGSGSGVDYYYGDLYLLAQVGTLGTVHLSAQSGSGDFGNGAVDTFIDPLFSVDPSTPDAAAYSFQFSPGVIEGAAIPGSVPEPATWALMLAGLGTIGFSMRRHKLALRARCI